MTHRLWRFLCGIAILPPLLLVLGETVAVDEGLMHNFPADRCHFNANGYGRVAARVAERIAAQGWIDTFLEKKRSLAANPLNRAG